MPAPPARLRRQVLAAVFAAGTLGAALAVAGCGGAKSPLLSKYPCTLRAGTAVARAVGVRPRRLHESISTSNAGNPECIFRVRGGPVVTAEVWVTPGAYTFLERSVVEDGQKFASVREVQPPINIPHLGFDADWLPDAQHLMTTDGDRLVIVKVDWLAVRQARRIAVAKTVARVYLGRLDIKNVPH